MSALDVINLIVAILAISVSLVAIFLSYRWTRDSQDALAETKAKLESIDRAASSIKEDVGRRLDDLVKRAAPSQEESAQTQLMLSILPELIKNPQQLSELMEIAEKLPTPDAD